MAGGGRAEYHAGKLASIQALRFAAAALVAFAHQAQGFARYTGEGLGFDAALDRQAQAAVSIFFVVSGYVMVISSRHLFGQPRAPRIFWTRRAVRILPPYWIATLFMVAVLVLLAGKPVDGSHLARSLALLPSWVADGSHRQQPVLWVGWTLFYEMIFYAIFGLFAALQRRRALLLTGGTLLALGLVGAFFQPANAFLFAATRPVLVIFIGGMALALYRERGGELSLAARWAALAAAVAAWLVIGQTEDVEALDLHYLLWSGLPALLLAVAVLGGPLRLPAPGLVNALGDLSYALYLLHVPAALFWIWARAFVPLPGGSWGFLISLLAGTLLASWLFFILIERPLTRWLNIRLGLRRLDDRLLQQTGI